MSSDTLILECPVCHEQFPVTTYSGNCSGTKYGIENSPLKVIAEVNESSKNGEIECIHCGLTIIVQVLYVVNVRPMSSLTFEGIKIS